MRVLYLSSEVVPFSKTGGLADVAGALPEALAQLGCEIRVLSPHYSGQKGGKQRTVSATTVPITVPINGRPQSLTLQTLADGSSNVRHYFAEHAGYFSRASLYVDPATGRDYPDNDERFVFLSRGALEWMRVDRWRPDIIHLNDWQTATTAAFLALLYRDDPALVQARTILTVHNLAYQGLFDAERFEVLGLDPGLFFPTSPFEFWGKIGFLKTGLVYADKLNTVSPTYAREIQSSPEFGCGLEGLLRERRADLSGILNGIDDAVWNPATDSLIPQTFTPAAPAGKKANKRYLLELCGFAKSRQDRPLIGMISRLADQKGFDLVAEAAQRIFALDVNLVLLGTGDPAFHTLFEEWNKRFATQFRAFLTFDNKLAHQIEAGSDMFLMPSRYEPCGLNQMYSLRYGTVPIVRATGGLADTVFDADDDAKRGNGFVFVDYTAEAMLAAVRRAVTAYGAPKRWATLMKRGMETDFSWRRSAQDYIALYEAALAAPPKERSSQPAVAVGR
ncbi:MAG: glycogen synthase GlgA [candidate division Zixibacteria bacterium]|nr:glycogen synthase GlgA [candidate division Zixibacteria bacterium]